MGVTPGLSMAVIMAVSSVMARGKLMPRLRLMLMLPMVMLVVTTLWLLLPAVSRGPRGSALPVLSRMLTRSPGRSATQWPGKSVCLWRPGSPARPAISPMLLSHRDMVLPSDMVSVLSLDMDMAVSSVDMDSSVVTWDKYCLLYSITKSD